MTVITKTVVQEQYSALNATILDTKFYLREKIEPSLTLLSAGRRDAVRSKSS